jgi:hypothetical protein
MPCSLIIPKETRCRIEAYAADLRSGQVAPGKRLTETLRSVHSPEINAEQLLAALLDTKEPCIFAESAVRGDGSDWTLLELSLLGDLSVATDVTAFDDGRHHDPTPHSVPFPATLVFTPGALLRNGCGQSPADWAEVTTATGQLDLNGFAALYFRRLRPVFDYINAHATQLGLRAFVTVPGLGCGQFAGPFQGKLGPHLDTVLESLLSKYAQAWPALRAICYDAYNECSPRRARHHDTDFLVRPLNKTPGGGRPQLCSPKDYAENPDDDFSTCRLYSLVAWDHVSWPGNDFNAGARATDDGVKTAATSALHSLTGIEGSYDKASHAYLPPLPNRMWSDLLGNRGFPVLTQFTPN